MSYERWPEYNDMLIKRGERESANMNCIIFIIKQVKSSQETQFLMHVYRLDFIISQFFVPRDLIIGEETTCQTKW